jgi:NitT/TauT family transport system substrate-binding protein
VSSSVAICTAPQLLSEDLLRAEGFAVVQHGTQATIGTLEEVAAGQVDIGISFIGPTIVQIDGGHAITVLAGVHPGCFELFGTDRVRSLMDLKGKKIAVVGFGSSPHIFLSSMLAHVGLDPRKDVEWITKPRPESIELLREGKVDAYMGSRPSPRSCAPGRSVTRW